MALSRTVIAERKSAVAAVFFTLLLFGCTLHQVSPSGWDHKRLGIAAVGDTNGYNTMQAEGQLKNIRELISGNDIFIFNAEGVFSKKLQFTDCRRFKRQSLFLGSPEVLDSLPRAEITVASLANNHILDCGREGLLETMQELKERGIMSVGAGGKIGEACKPLMLDIKGSKIAVIAYLEIDPAVQAYIGMPPDWFSPDRGMGAIASWQLCNGQKQIAEIRREADIIVVFVHMHQSTFSWTETPSSASISFVKDILDAGADIVIGTGPHVPQGVIMSDKSVALLSLGNFLMHPDYTMSEKAHRSVLADFILSYDHLKLAIVPLRLDILGIPHRASQEDAGIILNSIVSLSDQLGTTLQIQGQQGLLEMQRTSAERSRKAHVRNEGP